MRRTRAGCKRDKRSARASPVASGPRVPARAWAKISRACGGGAGGGQLPDASSGGAMVTVSGAGVGEGGGGGMWRTRRVWERAGALCRAWVGAQARIDNPGSPRQRGPLGGHAGAPPARRRLQQVRAKTGGAEEASAVVLSGRLNYRPSARERRRAQYENTHGR